MKLVPENGSLKRYLILRKKNLTIPKMRKKRLKIRNLLDNEWEIKTLCT